MADGQQFVPALIVVDFQEDFCPPNGSLAVPDGRSIAPHVNRLLSMPFKLKVATKDWHPPDHVSFASNHPDKEPFTSTITLANPQNPSETHEARLWPVHCVQGTEGAAFVPEFDAAKLNAVVEKGLDAEVEQYSGFGAAFRSPPVCQTGLADMLSQAGVTHVFVVGLAMDYCVKCTAIDAAGQGYETVVVEEGTKAVDGNGRKDAEKALSQAGVRMIKIDGPEVARVVERKGVE